MAKVGRKCADFVAFTPDPPSVLIFVQDFNRVTFQNGELGFVFSIVLAEYASVCQNLRRGGGGGNGGMHKRIGYNRLRAWLWITLSVGHFLDQGMRRNRCVEMLRLLN